MVVCKLATSICNSLLLIIKYWTFSTNLFERGTDSSEPTVATDPAERSKHIASYNFLAIVYVYPNYVYIPCSYDHAHA